MKNLHLIRISLVSLLFLLCSLPLIAQQITLQPGMSITQGGKVKKATYQLEQPAADSLPVIRISGDHITIDFNHSLLRGTGDPERPDMFRGIGILVENGSHITIKNLNARGYKVALLARNVTNLVLENCDLSYNYRPRLNSTQEKEDISDWMSYHQNEKDEWLRYGAAVYLKNCDSAIVRECRVTGGQNALMISGSNDGLIYNNDFSFNSGIGIGLYRSSRNQVLYNRIIFNVRGYSHGVYWRGQDSAGILVYEQSSQNLFYKNNVTHGGDGFFLWAGQTTMDTGTGGCNDNILMENDFSYAPTNGIEVTFSRNIILDNRIFECDHGIWGGYSYETLISDNKFRDNRIAIAIEHGQDNKIFHNLFSKDKEAIRLWSRKEQPAGWGYALHRDTRSRNYQVISNSFNGNDIVFNLSGTDSLYILGNTIRQARLDYKTDPSVTNLDTTEYEDLMEKAAEKPGIKIPQIKKPKDPFSGTHNRAGRKNIRMTEWGPYDFQSPLIWLTNPVDTSGQLHFELLGPKGKWTVKSVKGVKYLSATSGSFPSQLTATTIPSDNTDIVIELEYRGDAITTIFGQKIAKRKPYRFAFKKFFQPVKFNVRWFALDTARYNPISSGELFPPNVRMRPVKEEQRDRLDYAWWGGIKADTSVYSQFITVAEGEGVFEKGEYELGLTWDDAVRLYVDGKPVIEEWNPSKYSFDESPHRTVRLQLDGTHKFLVEHVELGGFATLSLKIRKIKK